MRWLERLPPDHRVGLGLAVGLLAWTCTANLYYPELPNPNETTRLYLTLAIVEDGTLAIDGPIARHGVVWDRAVSDGHVYCDKAPGVSLLAVPFLAFARALGASPSIDVAHAIARIGAVTLPSAVFSWLLFVALAPLVPNRGVRLVAVLLWAIASPARIYAALFFGHQTAAVAAAAAVLLLWSETPGRRRTFTAGLLLAFAVTCGYPAAVVLALAVVWIVARRDARARVGWLLAGAAGPLLSLAGYHTLAFGGPLTTGYHHLDSVSYAAAHRDGVVGITTPSAAALWGLLFSVRRGLLLMAPWLVWAAIGLVDLVRTPDLRRHGLFVAAVSAALLWVAASFAYWHGGDAPGPRHLIVALPLLTIAAAVGLQRLATFAPGAWLTAAAAIYSALLVNTVATSFVHFPQNLLNPYRDITLFLLARGDATTLLHLSMTVAVAFLLGALIVRRGERVRPRLAWLYALALAFLGLTIVLQSHGKDRNLAAARSQRYIVAKLHGGVPLPDDKPTNSRDWHIWEGNQAAAAGDVATAAAHYLEAR